jgi:ArsR family transcriptional regulator
VRSIAGVPSKLDLHAERLGALGHPVRLRIVRFVVQAGEGGAPAGEIQGRVRVPASTLSHHLKRLVACGVLTARLEGSFHFYAVDYAALRALTDYLWEDCCKRSASAPARVGSARSVTKRSAAAGC